MPDRFVKCQPNILDIRMPLVYARQASVIRKPLVYARQAQMFLKTLGEPPAGLAHFSTDF